MRERSTNLTLALRIQLNRSGHQVIVYHSDDVLHYDLVGVLVKERVHILENDKTSPISKTSQTKPTL